MKLSNKKNLLSTAVFFVCVVCTAQTPSVSHWSKSGIPNRQLDSILSVVIFENTDSLLCASSIISDQFDYKWYINFYNEQLGDYFSEATCINFGKRFYKKKNESLYDEIHITQFELPKKNLKRIKNSYGKGADGYRYFKLKIFTLYKFFIKGNSIYFVSTESYHPGEKDSFLNKVCDAIVNYK